MKEKTYILGSHNSWSFLPPKKWWMKLIGFTARCQNISISQQHYKYGVRCFDLRIRTDSKAYPHVCHGIIEYDIKPNQLRDYLTYLNNKGDCYVRVLHEVRNKKDYTPTAFNGFREFCSWAERTFPRIKWWCGRNLYNWEKDYDFGEDPMCEEMYSSVCAPNLIDDWWPWLFARRNNKKIRKNGTDKDILLIDYVNIQ